MRNGNATLPHVSQSAAIYRRHGRLPREADGTATRPAGGRQHQWLMPPHGQTTTDRLSISGQDADWSIDGSADPNRPPTLPQFFLSLPKFPGCQHSSPRPVTAAAVWSISSQIEEEAVGMNQPQVRSRNETAKRLFRTHHDTMEH